MLVNRKEARITSSIHHGHVSLDPLFVENVRGTIAIALNMAAAQQRAFIEYRDGEPRVVLNAPAEKTRYLHESCISHCTELVKWSTVKSKWLNLVA